MSNDDRPRGFPTFDHLLNIDFAEGTRRHEEFKAAQKARHKQLLAERKAKREEEKWLHKNHGFMGPPNPYKPHRKGGVR